MEWDQGALQALIQSRVQEVRRLSRASLEARADGAFGLVDATGPGGVHALITTDPAAQVAEYGTLAGGERPWGLTGLADAARSIGE